MNTLSGSGGGYDLAHLSIENVSAFKSEEEKEEEKPKGPLEERLKLKNWKDRSEAFEELAILFE